MRRGTPPREGPILPCTFHPAPEELLSSWLVRLAQAHRVKVESFCHYLWPGLTLWKRDFDKLAPPVVLQTLATRTLTPAPRIWQTTLAPVCERLMGVPLTTGQGLSCWIMPLTIRHRTHQGAGLAYCPGCLRRDGATPYYRTSWRLAFYVACPTCRCYLLDACPACEALVMFFRLDIGRPTVAFDQLLSTCYRCGFDLRQSPAVPVAARDLRRFKSLYRISQQGWCPAVPYAHQFFLVLRQVVRVLACPFGTARVLQAGLQTRLDRNQVGVSARAGGAFEQLPLLQRVYLLRQALWLLEAWPGRFLDVMRQYQLKSHAILRDAAGEVPYWFKSVVQEHFYQPIPGWRAAASGCTPAVIEEPSPKGAG